MNIYIYIWYKMIKYYHNCDNLSENIISNLLVSGCAVCTLWNYSLDLKKDKQNFASLHDGKLIDGDYNKSCIES